MSRSLGELAERAAAGVTRRGFFGWLGKGALPAAAALGGWLTFSGDAKAGFNFGNHDGKDGKHFDVLCCHYRCKVWSRDCWKEIETTLCVPGFFKKCPWVKFCKVWGRRESNCWECENNRE